MTRGVTVGIVENISELLNNPEGDAVKSRYMQLVSEWSGILCLNLPIRPTELFVGLVGG